VANTILQVLTSNTFDQWRIVTNTLVNAANELRNNTYLKDSGGMSLANGSITVTQGNIQIVNGSLQLDKTSGESLYIASDGRLVGTLTVGNVSSTGNITTTGTINAVNRLFVGGVNVQSTLAGAFQQANTAYNQANTAHNQANSAFGQANAAYAQANTANSIAISAYGQANVAFSLGGVVFNQANTAYNQANVARNQANTAYNQANTAYGQANAAYSQANSGFTLGGVVFNQANTAYGQANAAYSQANAAFAAANNAANTVRITANSGVAQSAVSLNFINTASVLVSVGAGSAGTANIGLAAVQGTTSIAGILQLTNSVTSTSTTTAATPNSVKSAFDQGNSAYGQANSAYGQANTAFALGGVVFNQANTANSTAISAYGQANTAYNQANVARNQANTAYNTANSAANTVRVTANSGVAQSAVSLNFVNTANIIVTVGAGVGGSANVSFDIPTIFPSLSVGTLSVSTLIANSVSAPAVSDSSSYRLRANQTSTGDGSFGVNQGGANGNAEIKFFSTTANWQLTSNNISGLYYNIITSQNVSDSVTTTSSSSVASSTAVKSAYDQGSAARNQANAAFSRANSAANTASVGANSGPSLSNVSFNFVNTSSVLVSVTPGGTGIANIAFSAVGDGTGTVQNIGTGIGLTGGPITTSGTISANIASTTVQGVTKLVNSVTSTDAANAAAAVAVKAAFDQATLGYGQANSAYNQANVATNRTQVSANSGSIRSNVAVNFVNTSTVLVSVGAGSAGNADVAFSVNPVFTGGVNIGREALPTYKFNLDFGADVAGTWRKVISTSLTNIPYSTVGFRIRIMDPKANHAVPGSVDNMVFQTYLVACARTEATNIGEPDSCYIRGPSNVVRAVKTAVGSYEIQVQNTQQYQEYYIEVDCYAINGSHTISYLDGLSAGATDANTANVYLASVGTNTQYFERIEAKNRIVVTADAAAGNTDTNITPGALSLRANLSNGIPNAFINMYASPTFGISVFEIGSSLGNYIDFKSPYADDFDYRIYSDGVGSSGLTIYAGSSTTSANLLNIVSGNVNINSGTLFVDYLANEVGIGTTTPAAKLDVAGNMLITHTGTSDALRINQTGTGNAFVVEDEANPDSTPFVIDGNGNVGIGTQANPSNKLIVVQNSALPDNLATSYGYLIDSSTSGTNNKIGLQGTIAIRGATGPAAHSYYGASGVASHEAPTTVVSVRGVGSYIASVGGGTITDAYGFFAQNAGLGTGGANAITRLYGYHVGDLTSGGTNYGFNSSVSAGANKWGFHAAGTANNYFNGSVGIGTNSNLDNFKLSVSGAARFINNVVVGGTTTDSTFIRQWTSADTDIDAIIPGSSFGSIIEAANSAHFVIGIRSNDNNDGFYVIDKQNGTIYSNTLLAVSNSEFLYKGTTIALLPQVTTAYAQANAAFTQANTANSIAISAYGQANLAFARANTAADQSNAARVYANSGSIQSNVSLNFVNTSTTVVSVTAGSAGNANISFTVVPRFTTEVNTTAGITSVGSIFTGTALGNGTLFNSGLSLQGNTANITNATVVLAASPDTAGLAYLELGGSTGGYIDFKAPNSDDYDHRIFSSTASGFTIYAGSTTAAANVLSIVSGNVNIDSGTLFVDYLADEVGIGTSNPTTKLDVVGSANVSGSLNVSVDIKSSGDIFGLDRVTIGSPSRITGISGITAVSGFTLAAASGSVLGDMALAHYSTALNDSSALKFVKSSSATVGTKSGISSGETLGEISFGGFGGAGTVARKAAVISSFAESSPTDSSMPGRLYFSTTPAGSITPIERVLITSTGFVGIGNLTPNATLDVVGTAIITNSVSGQDALRITKAAGTGNAFVVEDITNPDPTPFVIDDTGFVTVGHGQALLGIGSNPVHQLHATGAFSQRSRYGAFHWGGGPGVAPSLELNRSNTATDTVAVHGAVYPDDLLGSIRVSGSNGTQFILATKIDSEADGIATTGTPGRLVFLTNPGTGTSTAERMRITSTGNVGIGNTAPNHKLSVSGDTFVSGAAIFTGTVVNRPVASISSSTSYAENAAGKTIVVNSASPVTLTFNSAAYSGFTVDIIRKGAGNVTIANTSAIAKLNVASVQPASNITSRYATVRVTYTATNEFILTGSIQP